MNQLTPDERARIGRLFSIALRDTGQSKRVADFLWDTGQSKRVADFLLAWHNKEENGGWDPTDIWALDADIVVDIFATLVAIDSAHAYPGDLGFKSEIEAVWKLWRPATVLRLERNARATEDKS